MRNEVSFCLYARVLSAGTTTNKTSAASLFPTPQDLFRKHNVFKQALYLARDFDFLVHDLQETHVLSPALIALQKGEKNCFLFPKYTIFSFFLNVKSFRFYMEFSRTDDIEPFVSKFCEV